MKKSREKRELRDVVGMAWDGQASSGGACKVDKATPIASVFAVREDRVRQEKSELEKSGRFSCEKIKNKKIRKKFFFSSPSNLFKSRIQIQV